MFLLGVIVSICYVPGVTGAFVATWPVLSILLPLTLWRAGPMTIFHWAGLLFIAYASARLSHSPIFNDAVYGFWLLCLMGLSFWFGSTIGNLRGLYAGLAVGASASSVLAIFQALGYQGVPYVSLNPAGIYANSIAQGLILAMLIVALITERMWSWIPALLPGLALSGSRGAFLALGIGLLSVYVRRLWVFGILGTIGSVFLLSPLSASDGLRVFIWKVAGAHLTWLGWGPGSFFSLLIEYDGNRMYPEYAHNDALQLAFEYGAAAALPIGIAAFVLIRHQAKGWPVFVTFAIAGCYSPALSIPLASFLALVVAGRTVRDWALARRELHNRRFDFVPREHRRTDKVRSETVPVLTGH